MDLYTSDTLKDVLINIGIYDKKYEADLLKFHENWIGKNKHYIDMYSK
jgi:hypothetical protein